MVACPNINVLNDAIEHIYAAFADVEIPSVIPACECCISPEEVHELLTTPLRQLTAEQLSSYCSSVFLTSGSEIDFKFFIPRILDICLNDQFHYPDFEIVGKRLNSARWATWTEQQQSSIKTAFFIVLEMAILKEDGWKVDELICAFGLTGMDIRPYLERLEAENAKNSLMRFYEINVDDLSVNKLSNAFWEGHDSEAGIVIKWFTSPKVQGLIERNI